MLNIEKTYAFLTSKEAIIEKQKYYINITKILNINYILI